MVSVGEVLPVGPEAGVVGLDSVTWAFVAHHHHTLVVPSFHDDEIAPVPGQQVANKHEGGKELEKGHCELSLAHILTGRAGGYTSSESWDEEVADSRDDGDQL